MIGLTIGDVLTCAWPEPKDGTAGGVPVLGEGPTRFERLPGVSYARGSSPEPRRPAFPAGCGTAVRGTWSTGPGTIQAVRQDGGRTVFEFVLDIRWLTGFGAGGRGAALGDLWIDPSGVAIAVAREIFEGAVDGRSGTMTGWAMAHFQPTGRYVAHLYSLDGTDGLEGLRLEGDGVGYLGKSGHWTAPARYCFAGR